jgi:hypothetical protein
MSLVSTRPGESKVRFAPMSVTKAGFAVPRKRTSKGQAAGPPLHQKRGLVGEVRRDGSLKSESGRRSNLRCAAAPAS